MMKEFEFKGSTVESAIEKGLKKLGITREEAEIEVLNGEGIFTKALVKITPVKSDKEAIETQEEEVAEETEEIAAAEEKTEEKEEIEEKKNNRADNDRKNKERRPRERKEYFAEEKEKGKEYLKVVTSYFSDKVRIDAKSFEDEICFYIGGDDAKEFIGHRGETLDAIQYLLSQYINNDREDNHVRVTVDADFYRERRKRVLTALAKKLALQAYNEKKEIALEPMNSYERRIIHSALQNSDEATTRSDGEGKDRHIVIVPKCEVMTYGNVSAEFRKKGPGRTKSYGGKK
ncbi:MAG: RNA-binding cell elongation regulator Jag/EloR, partial [Christensenellales bacterium]